jgi:hypothetical protein
MEANGMQDIVDLERYPLSEPDSEAWRETVGRCRRDLSETGMFNLEGLLRDHVAERIAAEIQPVMDGASFLHKRRHNIYFEPDIQDLPVGHPAATEFETSNRTICADQMADSLILQIYEYRPLIGFLAAVMGKRALHVMEDPLARVNVMAYGAGEALNWHFDRSEFTTTLLLQAPEAGGVFEYRTGLRSDDDANYDGVARLVRGKDDAVRQLPLSPGTLNVFRGKNTAHRVTPVQGGRDRMVAVFSYYEHPGVMFSDAERIGFYGRAT